MLSVAQLVEHVTVDVCDHRVAGSIPAAETFLAACRRTQAVKGVDPKSTGLCPRRFESCRLRMPFRSGETTPGGTRTHNLWLRKPTPYPLGYRGCCFLLMKKVDLRKRSTTATKNYIVETRHSPAPTNVPSEVQCKDRWYVGSLLDQARHQSGM